MQKNIRYGFYEHLSSQFPSQIIVDLTENCNLSCIHCPHDDFVKSKIFRGRNLDVGIHKKLIDEVAINGKGYCMYLRYTAQGEPLMHPGAVELIEYACKYSGVSVNITTNGILLGERKTQKLIDSGIDVIDISIDAHKPETYARIRRKGDLNITRNNVLNLIKLIQQGGYKTKVVVSFVEQDLNKGEASDFEKFWYDAGVYFVVIRRLHSCAGAKEKVADALIKNKTGYRKPCLYPWERLVLSPTGQVGFCPADWKYQAKIAYLKDSSIKDIWQGEFMNKLREAHLENDFSDHSFCGQCPDWSAVRWPQEGRAYSNMMQELNDTDLHKENQSK